MTTRILALIVSVLLAQPVISKDKRIIDNYQIVSDYSLSYKWDATAGDWTKIGRQEYIFNPDGSLAASVSVNVNTGDPLSRTIYSYFENGKLKEYYFQNWDGSEWIYVRKYYLKYDADGRTINHTVEDFINGEWIYNRNQYNYVWEDGKLRSCTYQGWKNGGWEDTGIEYYFYDESGILNGSEAYDMSGNYINRVFYYNNSLGLRTGMLVQGWSNRTNDWLDNYRDTYSYNSCGKRILNMRERFALTMWVPERKTESFYKINFPDGVKKGKVALCHNGNTIYVSINAVESHLAHGDCLDECLIEKDPGHRNGTPGDELAKIPFTVYPNPARESVTIKFDADGCSESKRVELTDNYGRVLRAYNVESNGDLVIPRNNLQKGNYYLKVTGEKIYSVIIIFQ